jgi:DNA-3-methyladenine glycosylase
MPKPPLLPQSFYARDSLLVAEELLGQSIHHGDVVLRITEVEAYRHPNDSASHCRMGKTARNAPMWGAPGHAYVYLCYGVHDMLNFVTNGNGEGAAVLIRACEPLEGLETVLARRNRGRSATLRHTPAMLAGPGKVCSALGIDTGFSGHALFRKGGLEVRKGTPPVAILHGPRIGIAYASEEHRTAPWRLAAADSLWLSQPNGLRPRTKAP